jgi:hypothetical protein
VATEGIIENPTFSWPGHPACFEWASGKARQSALLSIMRIDFALLAVLIGISQDTMSGQDDQRMPRTKKR